MKQRNKVIAAILGLAAVICIGVGISSLLKEQNAGKVYEEVREEVQTQEPEEAAEPEAEEENRAGRGATGYSGGILRNCRVKIRISMHGLPYPERMWIIHRTERGR